MDLDNPLTQRQRDMFEKLLAELCATHGHGSVTIKVVYGRPKFISVEYERKLDEEVVK